MKALKGSAEEKALVERYVRELNEQEDRMQSLHHEMADLQQKRESAQKTLNEMIEGLADGGYVIDGVAHRSPCLSQWLSLKGDGCVRRGDPSSRW
jgi:hypothetical protein